MRVCSFMQCLLMSMLDCFMVSLANSFDCEYPGHVCMSMMPFETKRNVILLGSLYFPKMAFPDLVSCLTRPVDDLIFFFWSVISYVQQVETLAYSFRLGGLHDQRSSP